MSHNSRANKRARQRAQSTEWDTNLKFSPYQHHLSHGPRTRLRSMSQDQPVIHRTQFKDCKLRHVGFGLDISKEGHLGYGLRANMNFHAGTPITQYEGMLMTKRNAEKLRTGPHGKQRASHLATTSTRSMVINGVSLAHSSVTDTDQGGVPLERIDWRGRGGGSLCNHSDNPNAMLVRDNSNDGYGVFVVAIRDVMAGDFVHVDYGKGFLQSTKSNI